MFKEFKISDVFYKIDTPKIKAKAHDFPTEYSEEYCVPLLTAGAENQGLNRYAKISDCPMIINNVISVSANGANSGICFYQPHDFAVLQDAYAVKVNDREIDGVEEGLYLTVVLNKAIKDNHDRVNKAVWNHVKDDSVKLPIIESSDPDHEYTVDDIDWQYMHNRITGLERERITELDAYLQATGLNDYELTEDDKKVLSNNTIVFAKKQIGDLFIKVEAKCKKPDFDKRKDTSTEPNDEFCVPLINAKLGDNGIMFYGRPDDWNTQSMCIDVVQNGAVATGKVYAQPQSTAVLWDAYLIKPIKENPTEEVLLYFARCIEKVTKENFSYEKKATWERIKECNITVPITSDGTPDFEYMERYIRAMEKVVIADVVKYKDKVIETTRSIV